MPKIILKFEAAVIKEVPIITSTLTVGRGADNDIVIDHPAISRHHCRVILYGDSYFVEDLNSTNGTVVNGKKIIKAGLHHQDMIVVANHSLTFIDERPVTAEEVAQAYEKSTPALKAAPPPPPPPPPP